MEAIELTLDSPDGIIDCRLEADDDDTRTISATILYPASGAGRSQIYCYHMRANSSGDGYVFATADNDVHPKIARLEEQLSEAIVQATESGK